jgi:hypothetical protein
MTTHPTLAVIARYADGGPGLDDTRQRMPHQQECPPWHRVSVRACYASRHRKGGQAPYRTVTLNPSSVRIRRVRVSRGTGVR